MNGFCTECGKPMDLVRNCPQPQCPKLLKGRQQALEPRKVIRLPKPSTARRLLGSGIEYFTYEIVLIVLNVLSPLTGGFLGLFAAPLILLVVGIRDVKSGAFSIGKRVGGLRVVDYRTGRPISDLQAIKRNSYYLVLIVLIVVPFTKSIPTVIFTLLVIIDVLMIIANPEGRRIGDLLAGTQVIQQSRRR